MRNINFSEVSYLTLAMEDEFANAIVNIYTKDIHNK